MSVQLLHLDSSILGSNSISRRISAEAVAHIQKSLPSVATRYRDLAAEPIGHLSGAYLAGQAAVAQHEQSLQHELAQGEAVLEEFLAADILVIGAPMYNFTVPSQLKTWIDRILIAGKTFRYTETGAMGLVSGKRVVACLARGGFYGAGSAFQSADFQEPYLRTVFGFIGITDISFIHIEGVSVSAAQREEALRQASLAVRSLDFN